MFSAGLPLQALVAALHPRLHSLRVAQAARRRTIATVGISALVAAALALAGCGNTAVPPGQASEASASSLHRPPVAFGYPPHDTLRVATWNAEHFVDPYDNPYIDHPRENMPYRADEPSMDGRVDLFVEVVRAMDADVLVLQEFESTAYAEALANDRFPEMDYRFFASSESPDWYMNVVVVSRLPLGPLRSYAEVITPIVGATDSTGAPATQRLTNHRMWIADVWARPHYTVSLAGLHLKAGRGERNAGWRTGQIRWLRAEFGRVLQADPEANLLIAGDLNALPGSPELSLLLGDAAEARGPARFVDPLGGEAMPTHPAEAPTRQLDYLLPSTTMAPELVSGSVRVVQPFDAERQDRASDHLPVVGTFLTRD